MLTDTSSTWVGAEDFFLQGIKDCSPSWLNHYNKELLYSQIGKSLFNLNILKENDRYITNTDAEVTIKHIIYEHAEEVTRESNT